jgi:hypothetical protein
MLRRSTGEQEALGRALSKHRSVAMKELFTEDFVASVWTSAVTCAR